MRTLCLLLLLATSAAAANPVPVPRKKVIAWGGIDWYSPDTVRANIREIEKLPFDGMILQGFASSRRDESGKPVMFDWECFGRQRFQREELAATIETLKQIDFQQFTDNFLRYNVTPGDVDWFDNFDNILHNAAMWAAATKEVGAKGWMFDVEDYKGTVFNYQKMRHRDEHTFKEYSAQAQLRGRQFMGAVEAANSDIVLLLCLAHSYVNRTPDAAHKLAEVEYGLLPAFLNGLLEAVGPRVRMIDGHEQGYSYLTSEEFFRGYHATRRESLALVPPQLHQRYNHKMEMGMAVYANYTLGLFSYPGHWPTHYLSSRQRLQVLEQNIHSALQVSDEYLWVYNEHIGWWQGSGWAYRPLPGTLEAIRSARNKVRRREPLGFRVSPDLIHRARQVVSVANPYPSKDVTVTRLPAGSTMKLDGRADDAAWKAATPVLLQPQSSSAVATQVRAVFDDEQLYVAIRCTDNKMSELKSTGDGKDNDPIFDGDCIEVSFRAGDQQLPFHFAVDPRNRKWDGKGDFAEWNGDWRSQTRVEEQAWTVEMAIPWSNIGGRPPKGRALRAFFCRRHGASGEVTGAVRELNGLGVSAEAVVDDQAQP